MMMMMIMMKEEEDKEEKKKKKKWQLSVPSNFPGIFWKDYEDYLVGYFIQHECVLCI
jgi:hypothetical protein